MSNYKIGDRVEYIFDGVVQDIGTVTRVKNWDAGPWWARWDSDSMENTFDETDDAFRKATEWFENTSTRNIRPKFMFEFLMSDGTVRQGGINEVPGIDWNTIKEDDGYPHVVKYRMIGTI